MTARKGLRTSSRPAHMGRRVVMAAGAGLLALPAIAQPRSWPTGPVTVIVPFPAGAATDVSGRIIFDRVAQGWGVPVVFDNKGGGNGIAAAQIAARAKPDGHTLFLTSAMTHAANPALYGGRIPYDPITDFEPIGRLTQVPFFVLIRADSPLRTLEELSLTLKRQPGRHNFGAGSVPSRVASELYKLLTGSNVTHVGYRSNPQAWPDLINGQLTFMSVDPISTKPQIERGALRALVVSARERHAVLPDVPSAVEAGLPDFEISTWSALYAPKGTPMEIVRAVNQDIAAAMRHPETAARLVALAGSRAITSPEELRAFNVSELERWGDIIRRAGMKVE
jgi:tripartite-type tricarboxylate transporter receptor subunit TctC